MAYARIKDGAVAKRYEELPENYGNTSGFKFLPPPTLAARGWFPIVDVQPELGPYEEYGEPVIEIQAAQVVYTYPVVRPSVADVRTYRKREFKAEMASRIYALKDMEDIVIMLVSNAVPAAFKTKVEALNTAFSNAVAALDAATTRAQALAVVPVWPAN